MVLLEPLRSFSIKRLSRSRTDRKIAGICGGIGQTYDIDPTLVRLGLVFLCLLTAVMPVLATYIAGWIVIPEEPDGFGKDGI